MDSHSSGETYANAIRIEITTEIISAYVRNNTLQLQDLPKIITDVHEALLACEGAGASSAAVAEEFEKPTPAQIRKSITPDALISFIDGKPYMMLKRHLGRHGLDPSSYRRRYGLPNDYPMTAATHSAKRAEVARARGLGRYGSHAKAESEGAE